MLDSDAFGARYRARRTLRAGIAGLLLAGVIAAPAAAQDLCAGLQHAIGFAAGNFEALKISRRRDAYDAFPARALIPGSDQCEIRAPDGGVEYRCRMTRSTATSAEARAVFRRDVRRLQNCFAGVRARVHGDAAKAATGAVTWRPKPGLRASVIFFVAHDVVSVADGAAGSDEETVDEDTSSWIVIDKRTRR